MRCASLLRAPHESDRRAGTERAPTPFSPTPSLPEPPACRPMRPPVRRFVAYAWALLIYTVLVILWGGYVRATGAGAGCGAHWPLCNGEVLPRAPATATLVEFGHRLTSGLAGLLALGLLVGAFRVFPKGTLARKGAAWVVVFMGAEALIGMTLVKLELVAYNVSVLRGWVIAAHLLNTFLLLAALTLTAWWAGGGRALRFRGQGALGGALGATLAGVFVLGASGAVTALGDTLAIGGGIDPATDPVVAALVGLRLYHPLLALAVGVGVVASVVLVRRTERATAQVVGLGVLSLYLGQLAVGLVNVRLLAPVALQLVHLLLTDLIWIGLILLAASALGEPKARPERLGNLPGHHRGRPPGPFLGEVPDVEPVRVGEQMGVSDGVVEDDDSARR